MYTMRACTFLLAMVFISTVAAFSLESVIDCSTGKAPTAAIQVTNPYDEFVSIRTCNDVQGCYGVVNKNDTATRYGDCNFQVIQPKSTVKLVFDGRNTPPPPWPALDAVEYLVFHNENTAYPGICSQSNTTWQQALSRDEFWAKSLSQYPNNITWPDSHTIDFPQRTCHFCDDATAKPEYTMEVINPYPHSPMTFVKIRACRYAKCSGDMWELDRYDDCYAKIISNTSAKVHLDAAVQYVVFSCTGLENNGLEFLYKQKARWPQSFEVHCKPPRRIE